MDRVRVRTTVWVALTVAVCSGFGALAYRAWRTDLADDGIGLGGVRVREVDVPPVWPMWVLLVVAVLSVLLCVGLALWLWLKPERE